LTSYYWTCNRGWSRSLYRARNPRLELSTGRLDRDSAASADPIENTGDFAVAGVNIRTGPGLNYRSIGAGYPGQGAYLSCGQATSGWEWIEVQNIATGVRGWAKNSLMHAYCS